MRRGDLLVRFQIPSLEADAAARRSDLARAEAQLKTARQNVDRLTGLLQRGIAARKEVEDAQRDADEPARPRLHSADVLVGLALPAAHHPGLERHDGTVGLGVPVVGGERLAMLLPHLGRQVRDEGAGGGVVTGGRQDSASQGAVSGDGSGKPPSTRTS